MHIYNKNGKEYPSVTTILGCLGNEDLMRWSNALGLRHRTYDAFMRSAAEFGTIVHAHLRKVVDPNAVFDTPDFTSNDQVTRCHELVKRFEAYLENNFDEYETIATEKTMISENLGYAGTCDWLVKLNDHLILVDFKTSKRVKRTHLLQLGGYNNLLKDEGIHIEGAGILVCNLDYGVYLSPYSIDQIDYYGEIFNHLWEFYYHSEMLGVAPNVEFRAKLTKS